MKLEHSIAGLRASLRQARQAGKSIAFVPTMGNLHKGHVQLVTTARARAEFVVASVFVNPTQFGANEDFASYPRTLDADAAKLADAGCDLLFAPSADEMYPDGLTPATTVQVAGITELLCGRVRPGHFTGVATVVSKLFNLVQPDMAVFGEKDYQQLAVIRRMTTDLCFPISILGVPTVRADDGLALSSRNGYLSPEARELAPRLHQTLLQLRQAIDGGQRDYAQLADAAASHLSKCGFEPDYVEVRHQSLREARADDRDLVILVAARLDGTRLIDNLAFIRSE